jgi:hypothetical protein
MNARDLASMIRTSSALGTVGYADSVTVSDPIDERPQSAEFVITHSDTGTAYRITVTEIARAEKLEEELEMHENLLDNADTPEEYERLRKAVAEIRLEIANA